MTEQSKDLAHIHYRLNVVLEANGEDHDYLGQRMNSALAQAIGNGALTGESAATVGASEAKLTLLTPQAASIDEDQLATWLSMQIEDGHMRIEDMARLMARYALSDPADMLEEFAERMGLEGETQIRTDVPRGGA
jgi:hypothetical protein